MLTTAVALSESDEEDDVPQRKKKGNMLAKVCICYALTAAHAPTVMMLVVVWFKGLCQWTVSFAPVLLSSEAKALGRYDGCDLGAVVLPCLRDAAGLTYI